VTALGDASELGDGCSCDLIVSRHAFGGSPAVRSLALDQISNQHSPRSSVVTVPPATLVAAIADALS